MTPKNENRDSRIQERGLILGACLVSFLIVLINGITMIALIVFSIPYLLATPSPAATSVMVAAITLLLSVTNKTISIIWKITEAYEKVKIDREADRVKHKIVEDFADAHPPSNSQEVGDLINHLNRSEKNRNSRKLYLDTEKEELSLLNKLIDFLFKPKS